MRIPRHPIKRLRTNLRLAAIVHPPPLRLRCATLATLRLAPRARARAPILCRSRSSGCAPCRSCRTSRATLARHTASTVGRSLGGASRQRRGRSRTRSRARCGARGAHGRTRAWSTRRSRQPLGGVGRVGRAPYSITWSARHRTDCGIVSPIALAVLRLITSSNLVGCSTGRSPGLAPFRILSTKVAARRAKSFRSVA